MKLTDTQKATVKREWGAESNHILELIAKKKGKCTFFKDDGTLAKTKGEVEQILSKKEKRKKKGSEVAKEILSLIESATDKFDHISDFDEFTTILQTLEDSKEALEEKKEALIKESISSINEVIDENERKKKDLLIALRNTIGDGDQFKDYLKELNAEDFDVADSNMIEEENVDLVE